ncbi:MAG: queuosine salvage family protein [Myxococcota bacterium]
MSADFFEKIRSGCAAVVDRARWVRIDADALETLASEMSSGPPPPQINPAIHYVGEPEATVAFILCLDAINFGSGYFPYLVKRPGLSGYFTVASSLKELWEDTGALDARQLAGLSAADCARIIGQDLAVPEVAELMGLFARALNDMGHFLSDQFGGDPTGPIAYAGGSAGRLAELLAEMPLYRDVSHYDGLEVPFFKRAQLTSADLAAVFDGKGYGEFHDLDRLTIFADNLVPHVLRRLGVLAYASDLANRVDAEQRLEAGSLEEIEIRAAAVHAVERCVGLLREAGTDATAQQLDYALWTRGQSPEMKAHPRHRARSTYY